MQERADLLGGAPVLARVAGQRREGLDGGGHVAHRAAGEADLLEERELRGDARGLGKPAGDVPRPREIADRLAVGVPPHGRLRRLLEVADRARVVAGGLEVRGELGGDLARAVAVSGLLALADRLVQRAPPRRARSAGTACSGAARARTRSGLPASGPATRAPRASAGRAGPRTSSSQRSSTSATVRSIAAATEAAENSMPATLPASSMCCSSLPTRAICRSIICRRLSGTSRSTASSAARSSHPALARRDQAAREQVIDQRHHEQRVALGAHVDDVGELAGERAVREPLAEVVGDRRRAEQLEREVLGPPPGLELARERPGRGCSDRVGLDGAIGADQEQRARVPAAGRAARAGRSSPRRSSAGPREPARAARRPSAPRPLRHLAQHALSRGPGSSRCSASRSPGVEEPRHLHEPGGGVSAQERDEPIGRAPATEPAERVQHRADTAPSCRTVSTHCPVRNPHARIGAPRARGRRRRPRSCRCPARPSRTRPGVCRATRRRATSASDRGRDPGRRDAPRLGSHVANERRVRGHERRGLIAAPCRSASVSATPAMNR